MSLPVVEQLERTPPTWAIKAGAVGMWRRKGVHLSQPLCLATVNLIDFKRPIAQAFIRPWTITEEGSKITASFPFLQDKTIIGVYIPRNYAFHAELDGSQANAVFHEMDKRDSSFRFISKKHADQLLKEPEPSWQSCEEDEISPVEEWERPGEPKPPSLRPGPSQRRVSAPYSLAAQPQSEPTCFTNPGVGPERRLIFRSNSRPYR